VTIAGHVGNHAARALLRPTGHPTDKKVVYTTRTRHDVKTETINVGSLFLATVSHDGTTSRGDGKRKDQGKTLTMQESAGWKRVKYQQVVGTSTFGEETSCDGPLM
jgi:hypothetical protein